jgi:hypothetical protein
VVVELLNRTIRGISGFIRNSEGACALILTLVLMHLVVLTEC